MSIIYLVGPRGVGKTTAGKILAQRLNYHFQDQDHFFHQKYGKLGDFIKKYGWPRFNQNQFMILKKISTKKTVISTGGSVFMGDDNKNFDSEKVNFCKNQGLIILLAPSRFIKKSARLCFQRANLRDKSMLGEGFPPETFQEFYHSYQLKYRQYKKLSDFTVYDNTSPENAAKKILKKLNSQKRG